VRDLLDPLSPRLLDPAFARLFRLLGEAGALAGYTGVGGLRLFALDGTQFHASDNAVDMAASGRARWVIENGNNNVLKTKGYHLEHNFGHGHQDRMDYKTGQALGQPVGSGAVASTCSQYPRRFKLTGQFWSLEGDEAFLALDTLHRNERWHLLFPHDND
jgi:hypothetical protein